MAGHRDGAPSDRIVWLMASRGATNDGTTKLTSCAAQRREHVGSAEAYLIELLAILVRHGAAPYLRRESKQTADPAPDGGAAYRGRGRHK